MQIGRTHFNEEAVKKMSLSQFKEAYKAILKGENIEKIYNKITGGGKSKKLETKDNPE